MTFTIVGGGYAGLSLAEALLKRGDDVVVYGRTETNTPPNAIVHLFAGRTFARSQLEVLAFDRACDFWTDHPFADRMKVHRHIPDDSRLKASLERSDVPDAYKPTVLDHEWVEYEPAFVVRAWEYLESIRKTLDGRLIRKFLNRDDFPDNTVLAMGAEIANFVDAEWSRSGGQVVDATVEEELSSILIAEKLHIAPTTDGVSIGGWFDQNTLIDGQLDALTGLDPHVRSSWSGTRCALDGDRLPVIGWKDDEFVFAGFGSRGFFWMPFAVDCAIDALQSGSNASIPDALSVERV